LEPPGFQRRGKKISTTKVGTLLTFILSINAFAQGGRLTLFVLIFLLVTFIWLIRLKISGGYKPSSLDCKEAVAVVIPVVDEDPEVFTQVLASIKSQNPDELLVVINGPRNLPLEHICKVSQVEFRWLTEPSKRRSVIDGVQNTKSPIVVLVDSDTVWTQNTLSELVRPFGDPRVGGVTTRQSILNPERNLLTKWANWLEEIRVQYSLPTVSSLGTVGCLPGRTIAFRRQVIEDRTWDFLNDEFLGVHLEISDDRALTNYALMDGWETVYQSTSLVYTDCPTDFRTLLKQQLRWARGSQYNSLKMMFWMLKNSPMLAFFYICDILIPFMTVSIVLAWCIRWVFQLAAGNPFALAFEAVGQFWLALAILLAFGVLLSWIWVIIRFKRALDQHRSYVWLIPVFVLLNTFVLIPVRVYGFFVCAKRDSWGTRSGAYAAEHIDKPITNLPAVFGVILFAIFAGLGAAL
jgi:hyaluronan synthase